MEKFVLKFVKFKIFWNCEEMEGLKMRGRKIFFKKR